MDNVRFKQDGATCHTTQANMALMRVISSDRVFSRRGDVNWPHKCCDLTPLDYLNYRVYADKHLTLEHFKMNIPQVPAEILLRMCQKVVENDFAYNTKVWTKNLFVVKGKYFKCILFTSIIEAAKWITLFEAMTGSE